MPLTTYHFRHAVSVFSRMPTAAAARLLPSHLRPMEVQHGSGIIGVTAFDFIDSPAGAYREVVLAVVVPPHAKSDGMFPRSDGMFPKAAFYPLRVGTSTRSAAGHRAEAWRLPCWDADLEISFQDLGDRINVYVYEDAEPVVDFTVSCRKWNAVDQAYQTFMVDSDRTFKADFRLRGAMSVHEEERGRVKMHEHRLWREVELDEVEAIPFRELWMKNGVQVFEEIETFETL